MSFIFTSYIVTSGILRAPSSGMYIDSSKADVSSCASPAASTRHGLESLGTSWSPVVWRSCTVRQVALSLHDDVSDCDEALPQVGA